MNKDQVNGHIKQTKGVIRETIGKLFGDKTLERKGKVQNIVGKLQENQGDIKENLNKI